MDSIGSLIDELVTTNIKIYHLVDIVEQEIDDEIVAKAARTSQLLNRQRSKLVNSINERLGQAEMNIKL